MHDLIVGCRRAKENKHIFWGSKTRDIGVGGRGHQLWLVGRSLRWIQRQAPGRRLQYDAYQCCLCLGRARLFCFCQLARRPLEVESHGAIAFC
jgi:hypothetical protein